MKKAPKKKQPVDVETRLREAIRQELLKCDASVTPTICARTCTQAGYREVEETIITMVIHQHLMPAACVAQLEAEWSLE